MPGGPVAVVVPVYRQPEHLEAAVTSALDQRLAGGSVVAVVNDGCPHEQTHEIGERLARRHPDRVTYLRQPNRGVSAARNAGIEAALARWPDLQAVFCLDADNRLSRHTLEHLVATLGAHPGAAWASPAQTMVGEGEPAVWQLPGPYTIYRQLFDNQSDTGTLVRREVLDAGHRFDEGMRNGYEDWEFFLRLGLAGLTGVPAGECGFLYRRAEESMLTEARARHEQVYGQIVERHREHYAPPARTAREHRELPRWAIACVDTGRVEHLAAADLEPHVAGLDAFLADVRETGGGVAPGPFVPGLTLLATDALLEGLRASRLLAGLLIRLQLVMRERAVVGIELHRHRDPLGLGVLVEDGWHEDGLVARALPANALDEFGSAAPMGRALKLAVGEEVWRGGEPAPVPRDVLAPPGAGREPLAATSTPSVFSRLQHVRRFDTTLPWAGEGASHALLAHPGQQADPGADTLIPAADLDAGDLAALEALTR